MTIVQKKPEDMQQLHILVLRYDLKNGNSMSYYCLSQ